MTNEELRAVGTEFWRAFPASIGGNSNEQLRFLYRVVAHDKVGPGDQYAECLDPIAMQARPIIGIRLVELSDRLVHDYIFGEWGGIQWKEGEGEHGTGG